MNNSNNLKTKLKNSFDNEDQITLSLNLTNSNNKNSFELKNQQSLLNISKVCNKDNKVIEDNNNTSSFIIEKIKKDETSNEQKSKHKINIKSICVTVFLYYSTFDFLEKDYIITQLNLNKMLRDLKLLDKDNNINNNKNKGLRVFDIDCLIKRVRNKGKVMTTNQFLNFIVQISDKMYHDLFFCNPNKAIEKLVKNYFLDFYKYLTDSKNKGKLNSSSVFEINRYIETLIKSNTFSKNTILIFNNIYKTLNPIYQCYFINELSFNKDIDKIIKSSLENLIRFCKDFLITPFFIELNKLVLLYQKILEIEMEDITGINENNGEFFNINNENLGKIFTLSKFCCFLFLSSILTFEKLENTCNNKQFDEISNDEKLLLFLDKINDGDGLKKLQKNNIQFTNKNLSFLPEKNIIKKIDMILIKKNINKKDIKIINNNKNEEENEIEKNYLSNIEEENSKSNINNSNYKINNINNINIENYKKYLTLKNFEIINFYDKNKEELEDIFSQYSLIGDKVLIDKEIKMNLTGYISFLNSIQILKNNNIYKEYLNKKAIKYLNKENKNIFGNNDINFQNSKYVLNENDATLIFNSVIFQNSSSKKKTLTFPLFIKSFENITLKIYKNLNCENLLKFLMIYIQPILNKYKFSINKKDEIMQILSYIKDSIIMKIINEIKKFLYSIFLNFSNKDEYLNYDSFFLLYKEFSIFPDILSTYDLKIIFFTLADLFKEQLIFEILNKSDNISISNMDNLIKSNNFFNQSLINFNIFCETLGISAYYIKAFGNKDNDTNIDTFKILELIRKMSQKNAIDQVLKKSNFNSRTYNIAKEFTKAYELLKEKYLTDKKLLDKKNMLTNKNVLYSNESKYKKLLNSQTCFEDIISN